MHVSSWRPLHYAHRHIEAHGFAPWRMQHRPSRCNTTHRARRSWRHRPKLAARAPGFASCTTHTSYLMHPILSGGLSQNTTMVGEGAPRFIGADERHNTRQHDEQGRICLQRKPITPTARKALCKEIIHRQPTSALCIGLAAAYLSRARLVCLDKEGTQGSGKTHGKTRGSHMAPYHA